jgi:membrane fusion protein, multidrug efflux system
MTQGPAHSERFSHGGADSAGPRKGGSLLGWFSLLFLFFLALGLFIFSQRRAEHRVLAQQTERMKVPYVAVVHPTPIDSDSELVLPGNINSYIQAPIYARTNGYIKKWDRDIGSRVKQGDLLAELDTPEVDAQLLQARADLATARANLNLSSATAERYQGLLQTDAVSKQEVDNFSGDYAAKKAMVQSAEANVKRLEELESFKHVYSPIAGVVTQRNVDIGTLINAGAGSGVGSRPMFEVAKTDPLRVYVSVPQSNAPSIHPGLKACLELSEFPDRKFCGQVARTADAVDPGTRTLLTEVDVPNPSGTLLQGEYAQVRFNLILSGQRLTLPINALLFRPEGTFAAVVGSDSHLILKKVAIGRDFGNKVEVLQGLAAQDPVVINPPDSLEDGEQVALAPQNASSSSVKPAQSSKP